MMIFLISKLSLVGFLCRYCITTFFTSKIFLDELFSSEHSHATAEENKAKDARKIQIVPPQSQQQQQTQQQQQKAAHTRITFDREEVGIKKKSVLQRLGKRRSDEFDGESVKKSKTHGEDEKERRGKSVNVSRKSEVVAKPREVRFWLIYENNYSIN